MLFLLLVRFHSCCLGADVAHWRWGWSLSWVCISASCRILPTKVRFLSLPKDCYSSSWGSVINTKITWQCFLSLFCWYWCLCAFQPRKTCFRERTELGTFLLLSHTVILVQLWVSEYYKKQRDSRNGSSLPRTVSSPLTRKLSCQSLLQETRSPCVGRVPARQKACSLLQQACKPDHLFSSPFPFFLWKANVRVTAHFFRGIVLLACFDKDWLIACLHPQQCHCVCEIMSSTHCRAFKLHSQKAEVTRGISD